MDVAIATRAVKKITNEAMGMAEGEHFLLEPQDLKTMRAVLDYAHHRTVRHGKTIASYRDIQRLRRELGAIDDKKMQKQLSFSKLCI